MSFPYLAKSTLKYKSPHATDLSFAKGDTIRVTGPSPDDEDWLVGETLDGSKSGGFPRDFVEPVEEAQAEQGAAAGAPVPASVPKEDVPPGAIDKGVDEPLDMSSVPKDEPPPPSPKLEPADLPPSTDSPAVPPAPPSAESAPPPAAAVPAAAPPPSSPPASTNAPAAAPDSPSKGTDPSRMSMKERLAFFAAAQNKPAPPPIKPKPAAGGLTWSQRQKLRQEQEAKEKPEGGSAEAPAAAPAPAPVETTPTKSVQAAPAPASPTSPGGTKRGPMSSADAASSIGAAGSLKERMAALRNAGAFGQAAEEKPTPPKPSGKVWSRPAAPPEAEAEEEDDDGEGVSPSVEKVKSPLSEKSDSLAQAGEEGEAEEEEESEEAKEKARKAAIAARMAKIGSRGPMGMPPPKPTRKPTREAVASSPVEEKAAPQALPGMGQPAPPPGESEEGSTAEASAPAESAASAAPTSVPIAAVPRRAAPPRRRGGAPSGPRTAESTQPAPGKEMSVEKVHEDGTISPPPQVMVPDEEKPLPKSEEEQKAEEKAEKAGAGPGGAEGARAAGIALSSHEPKAQDEEEQEEKGATQREMPSSPPQPIGMVPLHAPAEPGPEDEEDGEEAPPPPPPRMTGLPKDEVELKHDHDAQEASQDVDEEAEEEGDDGVPPPVPAGRHEHMRTISSHALPAAPQPTQEEPEEMPQTDEPEEEEEDAPPPPPRRPSVPVPSPIQTTNLTALPAGDSSAASQTSTSPTSIKRAPSASRDAEPVAAPAAPEASSPTGDDEKVRRSGIAARMAKLGGVKFGVPHAPRKKSYMSSPDTPLSPRSEGPPAQTPPTSPGLEPPPAVEEASVPPPPVPAPAADDDSPEAEAARKRTILARLRGQGTLGFGMFHHGDQPQSPSQAEDPRGLEVDPLDEASPRVPGGRPGGPPPPPPPVDEDGDEAAPPPPPGRPSRQGTRDLPSPPVDDGPVKSPMSEVPPSPARSTSSRPPVPQPDRRASQQSRQSSVPPPQVDRRASQTSRQSSTVPPVPLGRPSGEGGRPGSGDYSMGDEPAVMMMNQSPPPPPPPPPGGMPATPQPQRQVSGSGDVPPSPARKDSVPPSPISTRSGAPGGPGEKKGSVESKPAFDQLQAASRDAGARVARSAKGVFEQGKKGYYGDGSPAGFVAIVMDSAKVSRPQNGWGQVVYEQEGASTLKKYDEPRPGDIVALYDARLKGRKGIQSYEQHIGSVEDALVGVIIDFDPKGKHKIKALQVERGVPGEMSYRCDDLKSGRIVVYRVGL